MFKSIMRSLGYVPELEYDSLRERNSSLANKLKTALDTIQTMQASEKCHMTDITALRDENDLLASKLNTAKSGIAAAELRLSEMSERIDQQNMNARKMADTLDARPFVGAAWVDATRAASFGLVAASGKVTRYTLKLNIVRKGNTKTLELRSLAASAKNRRELEQQALEITKACGIAASDTE